MKVLASERSRQLAEQNGWSLAYAQGSVDGEAFRRAGKAPSLHALVGIDQYSLGFRAGYFERQNVETRRSHPESPAKVIGQIRAG
jgi:hypothetical protein